MKAKNTILMLNKEDEERYEIMIWSWFYSWFPLASLHVNYWMILRLCFTTPILFAIVFDYLCQSRWTYAFLLIWVFGICFLLCHLTYPLYFSYFHSYECTILILSCRRSLLINNLLPWLSRSHSVWIMISSYLILSSLLLPYFILNFQSDHLNYGRTSTFYSDYRE